MTATIETIPAIVAATSALVDRLVEQKALASSMSVRVDFIWDDLLDAHAVYSRRDGSRILDHEDLYKAKDADFLYALAEEMIAAEIPCEASAKGHCPALAAKAEVTRTENALLRAVAPFIGIDPESAETMPSATRAGLLDAQIRLVNGAR